MGPISDILQLVRIMTGHWSGDTPLIGPIMDYVSEAYMHRLASISFTG